MPDPLLCALPGIISTVMDPVALFWSQVSVYVIAILFFGHIAALGYRGYLNRLAVLGLRLLLGALALVGGIALAPLLPMPGMFRAFFLDLGLAGTAYAALLLAAVWLLSHNVFNVRGIQKEQARLQHLLERAAAVAQQGRAERMRDPVLIAGIVALAVLVTVALVSFRGFPNLLNLALSAAGLSQGDFDTALRLLGQAAAGC